jgi:hypothetical protein
MLAFWAFKFVGVLPGYEYLLVCTSTRTSRTHTAVGCVQVSRAVMSHEWRPVTSPISSDVAFPGDGQTLATEIRVAYSFAFSLPLQLLLYRFFRLDVS